MSDSTRKEAIGSMARELLLRRARQAETASRMNAWLASPGLQPLDVPPGARTPAQAEAMSAADKLRTFARILDNLDEGAARFAGVE